MGIIEELRMARKKETPNISGIVKNLHNDVIRVIKYKNKNGYTSLTYNVPPITVGFPVYDCLAVSYSLAKLLKKDGFKVIQNGVGLIISWK